MRIEEAIAREGKSLSFEFFPPKTSEGEMNLLQTARNLERFEPTFVSVTYGAGGSTARNTRNMVERIGHETSLTVMPHLTCIGQTTNELKEILRGYRELGIENILALRGDLPQDAPPNENLCLARDMVELARSVDGFSIGVAAYPEGHPEAPSLDKDVEYTKEKIDAGADFAITQMFFDNTYFYNFVERAERAGITVPIIPGIMPIVDVDKIKRFCVMCGATLPPGLVGRIENARSPEEAREIGVDFAARQTEDLIQNGVNYFHFYTLNRADAVSEVLRRVRVAGSKAFASSRG